MTPRASLILDALALCDTMPQAVPLRWALAQTTPADAPAVRCTDCAYTPDGTMRRYCPVHAPVGHEAYTAQEIAARGRRMVAERSSRRGHMRAAQAKQIRTLLAEARWTHTEIARRVRVAHGTVTRIANDVAAQS